MNAGICYLIHNKTDYPSNKKKIIKAIERKNLDLDYIYDASVVEFRDDLYLIIDGHTSFLGDEKFIDKLAKLICPTYKDDSKGVKALENLLEFYFIIDEVEAMKDSLDEESLSNYEGMMEILKKLDFSLDKVPRASLRSGLMYGEDNELLYKLFAIESEPDILKQLSDDIFKATSEKVSVGEVRFVETLYQVELPF